MKGVFSFFWETTKIIIIAVVIVAPIRYFVFQPFFVKGQSMEPNFHNGDYLIIDEISYRFGEPERGDVVVFKYPNNPSQRYIKRIIGLPEERVFIDGSQTLIYGKDGSSRVINESEYLPESTATPGNVDMLLKQNEYFVMGDNRPFSSDSRSWGVLPEKNIIGRVFLRAWPLAALVKYE